MKKTSRILITVLVVAFVSTLSVPAYANKPHTTVGGRWEYLVDPYEDERWAGGNYFFTVTDTGTWTGGFEGTSEDIGKAVVDSSGSIFYKSMVSFDGKVWDESTGACLGEGTLEISFVGKCCDEEGGWQGTWVILNGTGSLATLHGQGTWGNDDPTQPVAYYSGQIHQAPD